MKKPQGASRRIDLTCKGCGHADSDHATGATEPKKAIRCPKCGSGNLVMDGKDWSNDGAVVVKAPKAPKMLKEKRVANPLLKQERVGNLQTSPWYPSDKVYKENGVPHRVDGPAIITAQGEFWAKHGVRHRIGGPAVTYKWGDKLWVQDGKLHRTDGPAVETASGVREWYLKGKKVAPF